MPQPKPVLRNDTSKRFHISRRYQRYLCKDCQMVEEMINNPKVISLKPSYGNKVQRKVEGIRGIYQVLFRKETSDKRIVEYKKSLCWCKSCITRDYDNCVTDSKWTRLDLEYIPPPPKSLPASSITEIVSVVSEIGIIPTIEQSPEIGIINAGYDVPIYDWSIESECFVQSIVGSFRNEDRGKVGVCSSIEGSGRLKSYAITWDDNSQSLLRRRDFYVDTK